MWPVSALPGAAVCCCCCCAAACCLLHAVSSRRSRAVISVAAAGTRRRRVQAHIHRPSPPSPTNQPSPSPSPAPSAPPPETLPAFLVHALTDCLLAQPDLQLRPHRKQRHQKNRKSHLHQRASFLSNNNYKTTTHECVRAHQRTSTALYLLFTFLDVLVDGPLSERPSPSPSPAAARQDDQHAASMPDDRVAVPHANLAATSSDPSAPPYPHPRPSSSFSLGFSTLQPAPALLVDGRWSPPSPSAAHLLEPACAERHL